MQVRYQKNIDEIFSEDLQKILLTKKIAVIGCGGQGGYIIEYLARLGVKEITFWDGDIFEESNLNRQLGCTIDTIGYKKAVVMKQRIESINPYMDYTWCDWYFGDKGISDVIRALQHDIVINAADTNYNGEELRSCLREVILSGIPVIECPAGIVGGFVAIETVQSIEHFDYQTNVCLTADKTIPCSQPAYKCALMAAEAVNQMVQYFNNCRFASIGSVLEIDMYHHRYNQHDKYGTF